jgi:hypothetical protein
MAAVDRQPPVCGLIRVAVQDDTVAWERKRS